MRDCANGSPAWQPQNSRGSTAETSCDRSVIDDGMIEPSARKLVAIGAIVLLIVAWAALVAAFAPFVGRWPIPAQSIFYLVIGIIWIIPLKPLVRWSQTGRFHKSRTGSD